VTHIRSSTRGVRGSNDVIPLYAPEKYFLAFAPQESSLLQIPLSLAAQKSIPQRCRISLYILAKGKNHIDMYFQYQINTDVIPRGRKKVVKMPQN
jgi:hypothetical protein